MKTNYILIDYENVQPESFPILDCDCFKVIVFKGAQQKSLSFKTVKAVHQLRGNGEYIEISGTAQNALDFHIAYYIGKYAAADPSAYFHIISKDKGFDPLIQHLRDQNIFISRNPSIQDIPLIQNLNAKTLTDRLQIILSKLQHLRAAKPGRIKALEGTIHALFLKRLPETEVKNLVKALAKQGYIQIKNDKVIYPSLSSHAAPQSNP